MRSKIVLIPVIKYFQVQKFVTLARIYIRESKHF